MLLSLSEFCWIWRSLILVLMFDLILYLLFTFLEDILYCNVFCYCLLKLDAQIELLLTLVIINNQEQIIRHFATFISWKTVLFYNVPNLYQQILHNFRFNCVKIARTTCSSFRLKQYIFTLGDFHHTYTDSGTERLHDWGFSYIFFEVAWLVVAENEPFYRGHKKWRSARCLTNNFQT